MLHFHKYMSGPILQMPSYWANCSCTDGYETNLSSIVCFLIDTDFLSLFTYTSNP